MEAARKILLIEDNPADARLLREVLQEIDYRPRFVFTHVERLDEGISRLKRERYDAVLLDLSLPDAHGLETVARMQREVDTVPIVVMTGLDDNATALDAVRMGAQDYLIKGEIDGRSLARALDYAIERKWFQEMKQRQIAGNMALKDINVALTSSLDLTKVLETLLGKVSGLMPNFAIAVSLLNKNSSALDLLSSRNFPEQEWIEAVAQANGWEDLAANVFRTKSLVIVQDIQHDPRVDDVEFYCKHGLSGYLGVPLIVGEQILGVLSFYSRNSHIFESEEVAFLSTLASQASMAIRNSQVYGDIKQLACDLERANHVKDEFLAVMSHELRTPINVVKGYVSLLKTRFFGEINSEQERALEKVANQTEEQLAMINSILHATSIESEVATVRADVVPLRNFFETLETLYPAQEDGRLAINWRYAADLPAVKIDQAKLKYIVQNLINNAVKFTSDGEVSVSAEVVDGSGAPFAEGAPAAGSLWLRVEVVDTGIGIPEEFLPMIFEKFSQIDASSKRTHGGIGLGLYIVKRCTEMLNGSIQVVSHPGKGSKFIVTVPCSIVAHGGVGGEARENNLATGRSESPVSL